MVPAVLIAVSHQSTRLPRASATTSPELALCTLRAVGTELVLDREVHAPAPRAAGRHLTALQAHKPARIDAHALVQPTAPPLPYLVLGKHLGSPAQDGRCSTSAEQVGALRDYEHMFSLARLLKAKRHRNVGHSRYNLGMDELIRYQVRVESGTEVSFDMRQPQRLRVGDRFSWQGRSFQVVTVRFHPDHPRQAVAIVIRTDVARESGRRRNPLPNSQPSQAGFALPD